MAPPDLLADLRLADLGLRRYATHLTGRRADRVLHAAYVSAARRPDPIIEGNRASIPMFREVHGNAAPVALLDDDDGSGSIENVLASMPFGQRSALLLTVLEGLSAAEAARVLAVPEPVVLDLVDRAADTIRQRVSALRIADSTMLHLALNDMPIEQAAPSFWDRVEAEVIATRPPDTTVMAPVIAEPPLRSIPPPPPRESFWPAVWAGIGAVAVMVLIIAFIESRRADEQVATAGPAPTETTLAPPTTADSQTTTTAASSPSITESTVPPATRPPAPPSTVAPTPPPTLEPPTSAPPTINPVVDRGFVPLSAGLAIIEGSVEPGSVDVWQVEVQSGQTLNITGSESGGIDWSVNRSDGSPLSAEYADGGLLVSTEPGTHLLRLANRGNAAAVYSVGVGVTGPQSGFLTNPDDQGFAVSALALTSCRLTADRLDATLTTTSGGGQHVIVVISNGPEADTVTWLGSSEAVGQIEATSPVSTGLVAVGTITVGPESVVGFPFWLGVYGCV